MHKKRIRKKIAKQLKAKAIRVAVARGTISCAQAICENAQYGSLVMITAWNAERFLSGVTVQRMRFTPSNVFYRRQFGYRDAIHKGQVINLEAKT